ncbi:hypothetical protein OG21DRAFT_1055726 [Imleria badia]|nr:hypothetical protein OG21DRAFT_1055726 [Imleria badia]
MTISLTPVSRLHMQRAQVLSSCSSKVASARVPSRRKQRPQCTPHLQRCHNTYPRASTSSSNNSTSVLTNPSVSNADDTASRFNILNDSTSSHSLPCSTQLLFLHHLFRQQSP